MSDTLTRQPRHHDDNAAAFAIESHEHHPRLKRLSLAPQVLDAFFASVEHVDVQALEYVPFLRFYLASMLEAQAGRDFASTLRQIVTSRASGGFVLSLDGVRDDRASFITFGTAIGHLMGPANHDAMSGTYYATFVVQDTDNSDSYLRQAYRLFTLHTDGTFVDDATDWLLMMKFAEKNSTGGESRLLHIDDWAEQGDYAAHPLARHKLLYKAPGSKNVASTIERPLFYDGDFGLSMSFIDQFVQPRTMDEALLLKAVSDSMEQSAGTVETPLAEGELVVINNHFWMHGRAAFQKHPGLHRELMRQRGQFQ